MKKLKFAALQRDLTLQEFADRRRHGVPGGARETTHEEATMTPEERWDRTERQMEKNAADIEKQNEGIRSLILVSRTVLDSVMELRQVQEHGNGRIAAIEATLDRFAAGMEELRQAQKHTDEKLNTLIDTIDRMIPNRGNGQQT